jgi:hypothetical protein
MPLRSKKCKHIFCKECFPTFGYQEDCFKCGQQGFADETELCPKLTDSLGRLNVKCPFKEATGCRWKGTYAESERHYKMEHGDSIDVAEAEAMEQPQQEQVAQRQPPAAATPPSSTTPGPPQGEEGKKAPSSSAATSTVATSTVQPDKVPTKMPVKAPMKAPMAVPVPVPVFVPVAANVVPQVAKAAVAVAPNSGTAKPPPPSNPASSKCCAACGKADAPKSCSVCKVTKYCSRDCQVANWKSHKKECKKLRPEEAVTHPPPPSATAPVPSQLSQQQADTINHYLANPNVLDPSSQAGTNPWRSGPARMHYDAIMGIGPGGDDEEDEDEYY